MVNHRLEHLGRCYDRLRALERLEDDPLLHERHERWTDLHAKVAAGDHYRVRLREHVVERVDSLRLLDLGDHVCRRRLLLEQRLEIADIGRGPHERERHEVTLEPERQDPCG